MATQNVLKPGTLVGKYQIREVVGFGGMGVVYKAADTTLPRLRVAIKSLTEINDKDMVARFHREAEALSQVPSRHVVKIYGRGELEGVPYIVMEFLHGQDLADLMKRERRLPVGRAVDIALGVSSGLWACHRQGIIHRDVKPRNIFLHDEGEGEIVKLVDFGVSLFPMAPEITAIDRIAGTLDYMSPEHASLQGVDERTDQFSLAVVLYQCITGAFPWPERATDLASHARRLLKGEFTPASQHVAGVPPELEAILQRALRPKPDDRFPSVREFGQRILPFASASGQGFFSSQLLEPLRPQPQLSGPVFRPRTTTETDAGPTVSERGPSAEETLLDPVEPISVVESVDPADATVSDTTKPSASEIAPTVPASPSRRMRPALLSRRVVAAALGAAALGAAGVIVVKAFTSGEPGAPAAFPPAESAEKFFSGTPLPAARDAAALVEDAKAAAPIADSAAAGQAVPGAAEGQRIVQPAAEAPRQQPKIEGTEEVSKKKRRRRRIERASDGSPILE